MSRHAPLPPSGAERWIACPGSVQAERDAAAGASSEFADLGTLAHDLFARGLLNGFAAAQLTADSLLSAPLDLALDATRRVLAGRAFLVELQLPALAGLGDVWGTCDVAGFSLAGPIDTIIDLKFGEALGVEANTPQLGIYGLLAARRFGVAPGGLTAWIVQPRHAHAAGPVRAHHYSLSDLDRLEVQLRRAVTATQTPDAPRHAGQWCRFCAAAAICPVRQAQPNAVKALPSAWFRPQPQGMRA